MKTNLTPQLKEWIERDATSFEPHLAAARKASLRKLPLYMIGSIVGLYALGIVAGMKTVGFSAAAANALRLHLPIGAGIALFIALFTVWQKSAVINRKTVVKVYERGAAEAFRALPEGEQTLFYTQMQEGRYNEVVYQEKPAPIPTKVMIGPDYWVYRAASSAVFAKAGDITAISLQQATARVTYETSSSKAAKGVAVGLQMVAEYQPNSVVSKPNETVMFFDSRNQAEPVLALIKKHCPHILLK